MEKPHFVDMHIQFLNQKGDEESRYMAYLLFLLAVGLSNYFSNWVVLGGLALSYIVQFNIWYGKKKMEEKESKEEVRL